MPKKKQLKTLGQKIWEGRKKRQWTQEFLAYKLGYSSSTVISKWENGKLIPNGIAMIELIKKLKIGWGKSIKTRTRKVQESSVGKFGARRESICYWTMIYVILPINDISAGFGWLVFCRLSSTRCKKKGKIPTCAIDPRLISCFSYYFLSISLAMLNWRLIFFGIYIIFQFQEAD